jgi:hypothetical protein
MVGRYSCMAWSDPLVRVAASSELRMRIIGAVEAGAITLVSSDFALTDVNVIAIDLRSPPRCGACE